MGAFGGFGGFGGFDDDEFFGGSGFSSMQMSSGMSGGGTSVKKSTVVQNGKRVTRTERTTIDAQGRKQTEVTE